MTIDTSAEAVARVLALATQGKPVQFNPQFCEEAKGAKAHDWDTSHDLSVIRADGSRYKIGHFRHADDALFDQLARELVPALSRDLEAMRAERDLAKVGRDTMGELWTKSEAERNAAIARAEQAEADADSWKTRADLSQAAIAAAMMGAVKPLEWVRGIVDYAKPLAGVKYVACSRTPAGQWTWWLDGESEIRNVFQSEAEAKAAAEADWQARNAALRVIPADALAALEAVKAQVRDEVLRSAAIAAGNAIVAIAADADPDISPLRKQMLRVKMEKAVKAAFTRDA